MMPNIYSYEEDLTFSQFGKNLDKKRAENALESCLNRGYAYVLDGEVRELG